NTYIGNVMTCRINRDSYIEHGSTRIAKEEPDFLSSDDPWFRPVMMDLGPDGAIYVADFYNRIIGHYEVPLDHPGRDRERWRIWRIVYRGDAKAVPTRKYDLTKAGPEQLTEALADPHFTYRMLAMNELVDRIGPAAIDALRARFESSRNSFQKVHCLWDLRRLEDQSERALRQAASDSDPLVLVHGMRAF